MPDRPHPLLSVIIPTFNRSFYLRAVLDALVQQDLDSSLFELIVVDDGSSDDTPEVAQAFSSGLALRYVRRENAGQASARNLGIYLSRGEILVFLDDDDIPSRSLLSEHLKIHEQFPDPRVAVLAYTELSESLKTDPLLAYVTTEGGQYFSYPALSEGGIYDWTTFWSGRISVKRSFLIEGGVFNPIFRFLEDVELGWRLSKLGLKVVFNKNARSVLIRNPGFEGICQRERNKGKYHFLLGYLYRDERIKSYARIENWREKWRRYAPFSENLYVSVKKLHDCLALRIKEGQSIDEHRPLLYEAYRKLLECFFYKGMSEGPQLVLDLGKKGYLVESQGKNLVISFPRGVRPLVSSVSLDKESFSYPLLEEIFRFSPKRFTVSPLGELAARAEIEKDLAEYLWEGIPQGSKTIEVDGVVATLVFLNKKMDHTALFSKAEGEEILQEYLKSKNREVDSLKILRGPTEERLAELKETGFDAAVMHGKKGFPYPFVEFLFLSKLLKAKGLLVVNDTFGYGCSLLCQYLLSLEKEWKLEKTFSGSMVFRKLKNLSQEERQSIKAFDLSGEEKTFTLVGPYWRETFIGEQDS
ncbi:glycosyltransferase family 2 protein [Candidatus Methylacidiphilum infernorum]|uniref:Glycosyltransferase n=1 Tax=Methylacidiphilum infernorum (isolate V4) TaxID=481448 RepID=B3DZ27_METI4|nr:glycosyltransferase family 2 protein [Candidatus Methylacidiphilum infernorum]ACD84119.1 Glycosyltransferase [Methylacidiphilum infernorum V4]